MSQALITLTLASRAGVLRAVAQAGGAALWASNGRPYEDAVALSVTFLDDASCTAGDAAGAALGDFVAAAGSAAAVDAVRPLPLAIHRAGSEWHFYSWCRINAAGQHDLFGIGGPDDVPVLRPN